MKLTTKERRREIKRMMAKKKHKQNDLAAYFGVTRTTIQNDLKAIGIYGATRSHVLVEKRRKLVEKMAKDGKTKQEIVIATGSNGSLIGSDLKKLGLRTVDQIEREERQKAAREKVLHLLQTTSLSDYEIRAEAKTSMEVIKSVRDEYFGGMTPQEWEKSKQTTHLWNLAIFAGAARS